MDGFKCEGRQTSFEVQETVSSSYEEESNGAEIEISIDSIENIIREKNITIKIEIDHDERILGESEILKIDSSYHNPTKAHNLDFSVVLPFSPTDLTSLREIVSSPILVKIHELYEIANPSNQDLGSNNKKKKNQSQSKRVSKTEIRLLGLCNIDLLPIILGESKYTEKLILEIPSYTWDASAVSWANLPKISITAQRVDSSESGHHELWFNLLSITIESIYNLPSNFTRDVEYKCGTVLPLYHDREESRIIFESGKWTDHRDVELIKSWRPLQNLESRARHSKYRINCDYNGVKNDFKRKFDLQAATKKNQARIEWNTLHRTVLGPDDLESFRKQITQYRYWPFEIVVSKKQDETKKMDGDTLDYLAYQCYVDLSQLLYPGRTKARVLAQLQYQNVKNLKKKTGLKTSIFNDEINGMFDEKSFNLSEADIENESDEEEEDVPLFMDTCKPVLVLIEFELFKPILPARVLEDYTLAMEELKMRPRPTEPLYVYTPDLAYDQYVDCIKKLIDDFGESYKDKLSRFKQYLHESGKYVTMQQTLKGKIINLLDQKFALNSPEWHSIDNQNFVCSCYEYLVEHMHIALNSKLDIRLAESPCGDDGPEEIQIRIEECWESENYEKADQLITKTIYNDKKNPNSWVKYAIHLMRVSKLKEAIECCREAVRLDSRHKASLLMYGILLTMKEEYTDAEVFLKAVVEIYPRFSIGWAILHLFYVKIQFYPGVDITLQSAEKCLKDRVQDEEVQPISNEEPLAWSTVLAKKERIFLSAAVLLLKMNLYDFAGMALAQDLCHNERDVEFLYFLSVNCYLQRDYKTALEYLNEAELIIGVEYSTNSLMGHSLYKLGKLHEAVEHYEIVDTLYDRPEDIYLEHLRMGFYYIENEHYERAKNVLLRASRCTKTCRLWLGVGIASYHMNQFDECECALIEANRLDGEDPEVWGYLCLLSISLNRYNEFSQCYRQMVKNKLTNDKIWQLVSESMASAGYSIPIIDLEDQNIRCTC
ncbi:hypothetical protein QAD02_001004 [Eretmocerus hayati]|uniref:Uncharacterized protein n=1 Tax=Eretmocerus hayati TaxID=131215 RepID=A0ACC2NEW2_9HYME|nr:hypothetical protein QAD02_001004 [Eretmocerus hayati]